jgi:anti-sigma regulatory factor (Ser/Thr protein kinase)
LSDQLLINIDDRSQVGEARRCAAELTKTLGFEDTAAGNVAIAVTEAATNLIKHAGGGSLLLRALQRDGIGGVEVLALDRGPGMNVATSLRDGHSTAGGMGTGLGALSRLSSSMQVFSETGRGTVLRLEFWARALTITAATGVQVAGLCLPKSGEVVSGDAWGVECKGGFCNVLVADGLGHGSDAARASRAAVGVLAAHPEAEPGDLMARAHGALATTRGAAVAAARFKIGDGRGQFAGIGNIAARIESAGARRQLVSHNGIVGHSVRKIQEFPFDLPADAVMILHSDGLSGHWTLADHPGLMAKHPAVIAGLLYRDHSRGRDDVTIIVIKIGEEA